jgi:hypothetical protein
MNGQTGCRPPDLVGENDEIQIRFSRLFTKSRTLSQLYPIANASLSMATRASLGVSAAIERLNLNSTATLRRGFKAEEMPLQR